MSTASSTPGDRGASASRPALLGAALASRDQAAFLSAFAPDAEAQLLATRVWANLVVLEASGIDDPSGAFEASWRARGERTGTHDTVDLVLDAGRITRLNPRGLSGPVWLYGPLARLAGRAATVVYDGQVAASTAQRWLTAADAARDLLAKAELGLPAAAWDGVLVVELPSPRDVSAVTGLSGDAALTAQAATVLSAPASAPRIVGRIDTTASLDDVALRTLLVHEGVHVATRSALSTAPLWVTEGFAESVAQASDPTTQARNLALAKAARPSTLPTPDALNGPDAPTAYALAAVAVHAAIARWGRPAFTGWVADWRASTHPSDADLTSVFLAALPR